MAAFFKDHFFVFIILGIFTARALARPGNLDEFMQGHHGDKCKEGQLGVIEVCQRCAKQTKSPIVYPMCCINEEDVYNWCERYINYGKKP